MSLEDKIFGLIDPHAESYWQGIVTVDGRSIEADLNIDDPSTSMEDVGKALALLEGVEAMARTAREAIEPLSKDDPDDPLALYLEVHRDDVGDAELAKILGLADVADISRATLVAGLVLHRVGVYPADEVETFVFDFRAPRHIVHYLLSVKLDADGVPVVVDMES